MKATYFASPEELRAWFAQHHAHERELLPNGETIAPLTRRTGPAKRDR